MGAPGGPGDKFQSRESEQRPEHHDDAGEHDPGREADGKDVGGDGHEAYVAKVQYQQRGDEQLGGDGDGD